MEDKTELDNKELTNKLEEIVIKSQSDGHVTDNSIAIDNHLLKNNEASNSKEIPLPGAVTPKCILNKSGISKSEINIRQILTHNECGTTVALPSLSFANPNTKQEENVTLANFIDINKFMVSCLKSNLKDPINTNDTKNKTTIVTDSPPNSNLLTPPTPDSFSLNIDSIEDTVSSNTDHNLAKDENINSKNSEISKPTELVTQRDSLSSIGSNVCRICMTRGRERLISPCHCKGSLASVHLSCLERWLNQAGRNHCELCGFSYPAIRTPRYTVLQALRLWFGNPRNRGHFQSDCLIFWLLSTVTAGLLAVCIVGTQYFVIEGNRVGKHGIMIGRKEEGISHRITETAMDFFMAIVLCGYTVTVYLLWKDHYVMWNRWRRANVNVRLLLTPDCDPVPFIPRPSYHI